MTATQEDRDLINRLKPVLKDLGWANGWKKDPSEIVRCQELKHKPKYFDLGPPNRGLENVVLCEACGIIHRFDSSD